jgi:hypothetical protein
MSQVNVAQKQKKVVINKKDLWMYTAISVVLLAIVNLVVFLTFASPIINISSDDSLVFSVFDDKLTFIINNDVKNQTKTFNIYGLNDTINISASEFFEDKSGEIIIVNFENSAMVQVHNIGEVPTKVGISLEPAKSGSYHGSIFVSNEGKVSVPLLIDIKPQMAILVMIVTDGIALSIALWSIIKFLNEKYKIGIEGFYLTTEAPDNPLTIETYLKAKKVTKSVVLKNIILDIGMIAFGIALGFTTLFDNPFITGVHNLGIIEIIVLIGIGLGIGSLKEIVIK